MVVYNPLLMATPTGGASYVTSAELLIIESVIVTKDFDISVSELILESVSVTVSA